MPTLLPPIGDDTRLIVVHPHYPQPHLLLTELLQGTSTAYIRFAGENLSQADLTAQVQTALAAQGSSLPASDLQLLVLDECDRAAARELTSFLKILIHHEYPRRVVILTRLLPNDLLEDAVLRAQTQFVPEDAALMLWNYATRQTSPALLEVFAFGAGRVLLNGQPIETWDGVLPRALFFYLVDRGMITRNDIFQTFWPNLLPKEATNVFHVTKRKINEVLKMDLTMFWSGFYRISSDLELSYDVATFSELVQNSAVADAGEAVSMLHKALALYRGDFLTSLNMPWVKNRRAELLQTYCEALTGLAKMYQQAGQLRDALGLYLRACAADREREETVYAIMQLYDQLGMPADALTVYHNFAAALETQPAAHLQAYAERLRDGR